MKVGDLVRHSMYSNEVSPAIVLKIRSNLDARRRSRRIPQILILDKGDIHWDRMCDYEVISESR